MEKLGYLIGLLIIVPLLTAWPVMLLWNWLMPDIFGLQELTFWQSIGLTLLCSFLFKDGSKANN